MMLSRRPPHPDSLWKVSWMAVHSASGKYALAGVGSGVPFPRCEERVEYSEGSGALGRFTAQLLQENVRALFLALYLAMGFFCDFCALAPSINKQIRSFDAPVIVPYAAW